MSTKLTVGKLIEQLEDLPDDLEVRVAFQKSWPLRGTIAAVNELESFQDGQHFAWIAVDEGGRHNESPYAPKGAWTGDEE